MVKKSEKYIIFINYQLIEGKKSCFYIFLNGFEFKGKIHIFYTHNYLDRFIYGCIQLLYISDLYNDFLLLFGAPWTAMGLSRHCG